MPKHNFKSSKSFEDAQNFTRTLKPEDIVDLYSLPPSEWAQMRAVGPLQAVGGHWLNIEPPSKDKKTKAFPKQCLAFDPQTEERDSTKKCHYCDDESGWIRNDLTYYQNFIIRSIEEEKPEKLGKRTDSEKETGFKEKGSKAWTPVRVVRLNAGLIRELKRVQKLNRHKNKKTGEKQSYPLTHAKYGRDVNIMYDPDEKNPSKRFSVQQGEVSPLDEDQSDYLLYNIEALFTPEKPKVAESEYKRWKGMVEKKFPGSFGEDGEEGDEDEDRMKKKSKKGKSKDEDEDDDEDNEFESKKSKKKKSRRDEDEDDEDQDDEDDEDEDEDEDEDDEPKSKKSKKSKSKKSKKSKSKKSRDEDDDEDEDEDDDEDDDD